MAEIRRSVGDSSASLTQREIADRCQLLSEAVYRVISRIDGGNGPRWKTAGKIFGFGKTSATHLFRILNEDPN